MAENKNAQQVREITDKLEQGIKELFESEKFKEYLTTMSKFYNYSFNNTLLIAMQKPDATLMSPAWLEDPNDLEETVLTSIMEQEFRLLLSERQLEVYLYCLLGGMSMTDYSKARGIDVTTVFEAKRDVQKKAKKFFGGTPKN